MKRSRRNGFTLLLALVWILVVTGAYFVYHKPVTLPSALHLLEIGGQCLAVLFLVVVGGGLGRLFCARLIKAVQLEDPATQAAAGLGGLSLVWLLLGVSLGYSVFLGWLTLLALALLLRRECLAWICALKRYECFFHPRGRLEKALAFGYLIILIATFFQAAAPPIKFDALVYHLSLPRRYLNDGRMVLVTDNPFWGMPQVGEMLYTWSLALGGLNCASLLGWALALLAQMSLANLVRERFDERYAWVALVCTLAGFTLASSIAWSYVDWITLLFGVGVLATLDDWLYSGERRYILLAGILAAFALGTKYTAGILALAGVVVLGWQHVRTSRSIRREKTGWSEKTKSTTYSHYFGDLAIFLGCVLIFSSPWWVKNWLTSGHPFFPLWGRNVASNPYQVNFSLRALWDTGWGDSLLLPFRMTVQGVEGSSGFGASIGPWLLGLAPFAFLGISRREARQRDLLKLSMVISLVGLVIWMLGARLADLLTQTRLYYTLFPAFAILAAGGFYGLERVKWTLAHSGAVRLGTVLSALMVLTFWLNSFQVSLASLNSEAPEQVAGFLSAQEYLAHNLGLYAYAMQAIQDLPQGSRVLMLWEARELYCQPRCTPDPLLENWRRLAVQAQDDTVREIAVGLASKGFTHVLYYKTGAEFVRADDLSYTPSDWQKLDDFLAELADPLDIGDAYSLYSLNK